MLLSTSTTPTIIISKNSSSAHNIFLILPYAPVGKACYTKLSIPSVLSTSMSLSLGVDFLGSWESQHPCFGLVSVFASFFSHIVHVLHSPLATVLG